MKAVEIVGDSKLCPKCGQLKPLAAFHRSATNWTKRQSHCAECRNATQRAKLQTFAEQTSAAAAPAPLAIIEPKCEVSDPERAYLAGIIDGEGCVSATYHKSSQAWTCYVTISNTDYRLIEWLDERWIATQCRMRPGTGGHKPTYGWTVTNARVYPVLVAALPFLVLKREQADLVMEWASLARPNVGRRGYPQEIRDRRLELLERIRALNKRGPKS